MVKWFETRQQDDRKEKRKLIIFPYAGGGASAFRKWHSLCQDTKLYVAQYPGRENRIGEPPIANFSTLLENIFAAYQAEILDTKPYEEGVI